MGFLAATLLVRIIVALRQWENVHQNKKVMFAVAVFVSMLEPMAGQRILYTTLDLSNRQSALKRHIIEKKSIAAMRNVGVLMLAFEDVPELILDVIYIFRKGGKIPDMTLFIFTIVLSVLHMVRVIAEFQFESKTLDRLPVILEVGNPDNEADKPSRISSIFSLSWLWGTAKRLNQSMKLEEFTRRRWRELNKCDLPESRTNAANMCDSSPDIAPLDKHVKPLLTKLSSYSRFLDQI